MNTHPNALTPNIDKLAERGTLFTNAHISAPLCGSSRASLLSGLHPFTSGVYGHIHFPVLIQNPVLENITFLPQYMAEHGYTNHGIRDMRWRYIRYEDGTEELYDHFTDPHEWQNLAENSHYTIILDQMRKRLPENNAFTDPNGKSGMDYNDYFRELFEKTRADKQTTN